MSRLSASVTWRSPGKIKGRMDVPGPLARKDSAMTRRIVLLATSMALFFAGARAQLPDPAAPDEKVLRAANVKTDPASLLDFFRQRTFPDAEREKYRAYVKQLGSDVFRQ